MHYLFFIFLFFQGKAPALLPVCPGPVRGNGLPAPSNVKEQQRRPTSSREPCSSLELSLCDAAGIWFKTPLPVGGANTATIPQPDSPDHRASVAGSVGVTTGFVFPGNTH